MLSGDFLSPQDVKVKPNATKARGANKVIFLMITSY
jgi:hypothetical protein